MKIFKAYKFRLYPDNNQAIFINKTLGSSRFVYNYYLNLKQKEYQTNKNKISCYDCIKDLKSLGVTYPWLKEIDSTALRTSLFDLDDAFKRFFKQQTSFPNFKKKNTKNSYRTSNMKSEYKGKQYESIKLDLINKMITLPKLKEVKIRGYRNISSIKGNIKSATISKEASGKYYVSVLIEQDIIVSKKETKTIVGIDLGIKDLVITSSNEKYENPKAINKYENRIKRLQRLLSKKQKQSNNYKKLRQKIAISYSKLKNTRTHAIHQITNKLIKENDIIVSEKLKVTEMTKNHHLSKKILDACFSEITRQLEYKSKWKNTTYIQIDSYYPSSQTCSRCNYKNKKLKDLSIRKWECEKCHTVHDRDYNAAENILFEGLKKYMSLLV